MITIYRFHKPSISSTKRKKQLDLGFTVEHKTHKISKLASLIHWTYANFSQHEKCFECISLDYSHWCLIEPTAAQHNTTGKAGQSQAHCIEQHSTATENHSIALNFIYTKFMLNSCVCVFMCARLSNAILLQTIWWFIVCRRCGCGWIKPRIEFSGSTVKSHFDMKDNGVYFRGDDNATSTVTNSISMTLSNIDGCPFRWGSRSNAAKRWRSLRLPHVLTSS